jgi:hypothetical protein
MTWPTCAQALDAIAKLSDEQDIRGIKRSALEAYDFTVGPRDPRVSTDFPGVFMVVECLNDRELPFTNPQDGSGDFALVGDDLDQLINESFNVLCEMCGL